MSSVRFAHAFAYVDDPARAARFYADAFGFKVRAVDPDGRFALLDTGATSLGFTSHEMGAAALPDGYERTDPAAPPLGFKFALQTDDVAAAVEAVVRAGGTIVAAPQVRPWGQTVAYVRDPEGVLVELVS